MDLAAKLQIKPGTSVAVVGSRLQLDTDINRDSLARVVGELGVRPVRQVALDDMWSALRFRPA